MDLQRWYCKILSPSPRDGFPQSLSYLGWAYVDCMHYGLELARNLHGDLRRSGTTSRMRKMVKISKSQWSVLSGFPLVFRIIHSLINMIGFVLRSYIQFSTFSHLGDSGFPDVVQDPGSRLWRATKSRLVSMKSSTSLSFHTRKC